MKVNKQSASKSSFAQMVAGLSHHLNNPLAAILGYSELLLCRDLDAGAKGMVELIHQQAERCKQTLQSLNAMTRRPSQGFQAVDLGILALECVALKTTEFEPHQIQVNQDFPAYLIISDIQMPGMTGIELHQCLASGDSTLANRMILITGSTWAQRETLLPKSKAQLLYKPFSRNELLEAISRAIAEQSPEERST